MRTPGLVFLFVAFSLSAFAQFPFQLESAHHINAGVWASHYDEEGNFYATGQFFATNNFDLKGGVVSKFCDDPEGELYVAKYNSDEELLWVKAIYGTAGWENSIRIKTDPFGNVFVVGTFEGIADLDLDEENPGGYVLGTNGSEDGFIVKFGSDGTFLNARSLTVTTTSIDELTDLDFDSEGAVYVVGADDLNGRIIKLSNDLNTIAYNRVLVSTAGIGYNKVAVRDDRLLLTGSFVGTLDLDPDDVGVTNITSAGGIDLFMAEYDLSTGSFIPGSGYRIGGLGSEVLADAAFVGDDVYFSAYFTQSFTHDGITLTNHGSADVLLGRYTFGQQLVWAHGIGGAGQDIPYEIRVNSSGAAYATGYINGLVDFDPDPVDTYEISAFEAEDGFLVKLDRDGDFRKAIVLGNTGLDLIDAVAIDSRDRVRIGTYLVDLAAVDIDPSADVVNASGSPVLIDYYELPSITSLSATSGAPGDIVEIHGENFHVNPDENIVYFGSTRALVTDADETSLVVVVPFGATLAPVSVRVNGMITYSSEKFTPTFSFYGDMAASFSDRVDFSTDPGYARHVATGDLDGDGKTDMAVVAQNQDRVDIYANTSAVSSIDPSSFTFATSVNAGDEPFTATLADINGDGLPEVITGGFANTIFIHLNTSTPGSISFGSVYTLYPSGSIYSIAVHDLNLDGRPEILAATSTGFADAFINTSQGSMSFGSQLALGTSGECWGVAAGDIDGDLHPDIVATGSNGSLFFFRNLMSPGSLGALQFDLPVEIPGVALETRSIALADFDGDSRLDFAVGSSSTNSSIAIIENLSTAGAFSYNAAISVIPSPSSEMVTAGDVDGDGRTDLIGCYPGTNEITIFFNDYQTGTLNAGAFTRSHFLQVGGMPANVAFSDLDGDGRGDFAVPHAGNVTVSLFRNLNTNFEPGTQPADLTFNEITSHSLRGAFTPAPDVPDTPEPDVPDGYIVIRKEGDATPEIVPQDGVAYPVGYVFPEDGSVVVYSGNQPYFNCSGLETAGAHTFSVFSFNGVFNAVNYNTDQPLTATVFMDAGSSLHSTYFGWAKHIGGTGFEGANAIEVGPDGSVYVTGEYHSSDVDFDPGAGIVNLPKTTLGGDAFVAKYNASGDLIWVRHGSSTGDGTERGEGIGVDDLGNVYIMGRFDTDIVFEDGIIRNTNGGQDVFMARYDVNGNFLWAWTIGSPGDDGEDHRNGFAVDGAGNFYLAGEFQNTIPFFDGLLQGSVTSHGLRDIYVVKYEPTFGDMVWVRQIGGSENDYSRDLTLDEDGNVLVIGQFDSPSLEVEGMATPLVSAGLTDIVVVKFDTDDGTPIWANSLGGASYDFGEGITTDENRAVYITGTFRHHTDFDPGPGISYLYADNDFDQVFLAKYDASGAIQWAKPLASNSNASSYGIRLAADGIGSVYAYGIFQSSLNADGNSGDYFVNEAGAFDNIIYKYSHDGFLRWAGTIGGTGNDYAHDIALTPSNEIVLTGIFEGSNVVVDPISGSTSFNALGSHDMFIVKLGDTDPTFSTIPLVSGFSPESGGAGSLVTIQGGNFNADPALNVVYFGAARAVVTAGDDDELQVRVPAGATYAPISVTTRGLTATSTERFVITYPIGAPITGGSFEAQVDFSVDPDANPTRIAVADFNNDERVDIVVVSPSVNQLSILQSGAEAGSITPASFPVRSVIPTATLPQDVDVGDLDGDGKIDMAVVCGTGGESKVSLYRNKGQFSFDLLNFFTGSDPVEVAIGDLDLDGRPEVITLNRLAGTLSIFPNRATPGNLSSNSFGDPIELVTGPQPQGLALGDFNNDGRPDLVVTNRGDNTITFLENQTTPGSVLPQFFIDFVFDAGMGPGGFGTLGPGRISVGDLDVDGSNDIVVAGPGSASFSIFHNNNDPFGPPQNFETGSYINATAIHDLTGDGKPDLVAVTNDIFENQTNVEDIGPSGFVSIARIITGAQPWDIAIADFDADGRPDLAFADRTDGKVSILRNNAVLASPTVQASGLSLISITHDLADVSFTPGDGNRHLFVVKQGPTIDAVPVDASIYQSTWQYPSSSDLGNGNYVVGSGAADWTQLSVSGLAPATQYAAAIFAFNDTGTEPTVTTEYSRFLTDLTGVAQNPISFYTLDTEPPQHPATFTATAAGTSITLDFDSPLAANAEGYLILRREDGTAPDANGIFDGMDETGFALPSGTTLVATVDEATASYVDTNLAEEVTYHYALVPFNGLPDVAETRNYLLDGTLASAFAQAQALASEPLNAPTAFDFTNVTLDGYTVQFTAAADNPTGYIAIRMQGADNDPSILPVDQTEYALGEIEVGTNQFIAYVGTATEFTETGLAPGETYVYRIYSLNGAGTSVNYLTGTYLSGTAKTRAPEPLNAATNFQVSDRTSSSLVLSFDIAADAPDGYLIVRNQGTPPEGIPVDGIAYDAKTELEAGTGEMVVWVGVLPQGPFSFEEDFNMAESTTYHYTIYSFNGEGKTINYLTSPRAETSGTTLGPDSEDPVVTIHHGNTVELGSAASINISVEDVSGVTSAYIYYRKISSDAGAAYSPEELTNTGGTTYEAEIPPSDIGELGIEYYFEITDGAANTLIKDEQLPLRTITVVVVDNGLNIPYNSFGDQVSNYRIIAVPLELDNKAVSAVFTDDLDAYDNERWRMFHYSNGRNAEVSAGTSVQAGKGYWLIVKDGGVTIDTGPGEVVGINSQGFEIVLEAGWNQIGNPYNFNIAWQDVVAANPTVDLPDAIRVYSGTFSDGDRLNSFQGGFINVPAGGSIFIPKTKNPSVNRGIPSEGRRMENPIDDAEWEVRFTVEQGEMTNLISGFGMRPDAREGFDRYDGFSMPPFFGYLDVRHGKALNGFHYSKDIIPTAENHVWEFTVESSQEAGGNVTVSWDNHYFANSQKSLILWDVNLQLGIDMKTQARYEFDPGTSREFKVIFGAPAFVDESTRVSAMVFHHVRPNPVGNGEEAAICFTLPEAAPVVIELLDVTGKQAALVFDGTLESGYHEILYDHAEYHHRPGVYVARIRSGAVTAQKRIVLSH